MQERIVGPVGRRNEAEAFKRDEPLHCATHLLDWPRSFCGAAIFYYLQVFPPYSWKPQKEANIFYFIRPEQLFGHSACRRVDIDQSKTHGLGVAREPSSILSV